MQSVKHIDSISKPISPGRILLARPGPNRGKVWSRWGLTLLLFASALAAPVWAQVIPPCDPPPQGLVSWWPGEGNANDIGPSGNNGTVLGGTTFTDAKVGKGFTFSSNADGVTIPHKDNLNVQSPGFSAEFWIRGSVQDQPQMLFTPVDKSHGFIDNTGWAFQGNSSNGTISFIIGAGGGPPFTNFPGVTSAGSVLDGGFHHVAGTWDGNVRLYVDGVPQVPQGNTALPMPVNNTRALLIGFASGGGSPQRFFRGQVDELTIYNRALTEAEILAIFQAGSAGKCKPGVRAVYITNSGSTTVSVINPSTNTVVATVTVGPNPVHAAVTPNGATANITNAGANTVSVINTSINSVVATVTVGLRPVHAAITPDGSSVYVTNAGANSVSVIGTASNSVVATIPVGIDPVHVAITPDGTRAYVTNAGSNTVSVINTATHTVTATAPVGANPVNAAIF